MSELSEKVNGIKEATLLSYEQVVGNEKTDIFKQIDGKCAVSDFAILLGAVPYWKHYSDLDNDPAKCVAAAWCVLPFYHNGRVHEITYDNRESIVSDGRECGVRPVILYSNLSDICPNSNAVKGRRGLLEIEYGEYPQYAADNNLQRILWSELKAGRLKQTGKTYTTDSRKTETIFPNRFRFRPVEHKEFEYNEKKYVLVKPRIEHGPPLTNGMQYFEYNDYAWVEVSPITWLVDEKAKMLVSKISLASGISFLNHGKDKENFKSTEMYMFLNKYFINDIQVKNPKKYISYSNNAEIQKVIKEINEVCEKLPVEINNKIISKLDDYTKDYHKELEDLDREKNASVSFDKKKSINLTLNPSNNPEINYLNKLNSLLNSLYREKFLLIEIQKIQSYRELIKKDVTEVPVNDGTIEYIISSFVYLSNKYSSLLKKEIIERVNLSINNSIDKANNLMNKSLDNKIILTLDNNKNITMMLYDELYALLEEVRKYDTITKPYIALRDALANENNINQFKKVDSLVDMLNQIQYAISLIEIKEVKESLIKDYRKMCDKYLALLDSKLNNLNVTKEELATIKPLLIEDLQDILIKVNKQSRMDYNKVIISNSDDYLKKVLEESLTNIDNNEWQNTVDIPLGYSKVKLIRNFIEEIYKKILNSTMNNTQKKQLTDELKGYIYSWIEDVNNQENINQLLKKITNKLANMLYTLDDIVKSRTK